MADWFGLAQEIVDVIGEDAALKLLSARGGTEVHIPARVPGSQIAGIIGLDAATLMADHFGPGKLRLPTGSARGTGGRRAQALAMLRTGASIREVALACGLHARTVENYSAQLNAADDARQTGFDF